MIFFVAAILAWATFLTLYMIMPMINPPRAAKDVVITNVRVFVDDEVFSLKLFEARPNFSHAFPLMVTLMRSDNQLKLQQVIAEKMGRQHPLELCFALIDYTYDSQQYTCVYPIHRVTDAVAYPPIPLFKTVQRDNHTIERAVLTVKGKGASATCDVSKTIAAIKGPSEDFHLSTGAGFQLRRRLLRALVHSRIQRLVTTIERQQVVTKDQFAVLRGDEQCFSAHVVLHLAGRVRPIVVRLQ